MDTYNGLLALQNHETYAWIVLPFCAISFAGAYMQYFGAIRNGYRDRTYSIPLGCNLWFFAHDTTYVAMGWHWFHDVGHWLVKAFWVALLVFACCEMIVLSQVVRFSGNDLFPGLTRLQILGVLAASQAGFYVLFWWFHDLARDPIYLICFTTTVVLTPVLTIPMMLRRGSRRGFSRFMLTGYVLLAVGFYPWVFCVEEYFRQPLFIGLGVANILVSFVPLWLYGRLPAWEPDSEDAEPKPSSRLRLSG